MQYDAALKRAERLLRKNWASVQREAHALAAEGLPVEVTDYTVTITFLPRISGASRGQEVSINYEGVIEAASLIQWQDGHWEVDDRWEVGSREDVASVLASILKEQEALAQQMGEVAEELASRR